jgi:hypothetical protein
VRIDASPMKSFATVVGEIKENYRRKSQMSCGKCAKKTKKKATKKKPAKKAAKKPAKKAAKKPAKKPAKKKKK